LADFFYIFASILQWYFKITLSAR